MNCVPSFSAKYLGRKSPPIPANQCPPFTIRTGNDGKQYIAKPDKNNVNRWVLHSDTKKVSRVEIDQVDVKKAVSQIKKQISGFDIKKGVMEYSQLRPRQVQANKEKFLGKFVDQYFVSQKYDGWQAVWDGKNTLMTKTGKNIFPYPDSWKLFLPPFPVAGELIIEGKQAASVASLKKKDSKDWLNAKLMVFDEPYSKDAFYKRTAKLKNTLKKTGPIIYVEQHLVTSIDMLYNFYKDILARKGEGVVLTEKESLYTPMNRSGSRVKLKGRQDSEGKIVSYNLKDGKLSSLVLELPNKIRFNLGIGFKNNERIKYKEFFPLHKYAKFSYRELTDGKKPKQARFVAIRQDL